MKTSNLVLVVMCFIAGTTFAQNVAVTKNADLKTEEVPAAVRSSFEKEFGSSLTDGSWKVFFSTSRQDGRTVANPLWYTYNKKESGNKIEIRYFPNGKLKSVKGIERKHEVYDSDKGQPVEKTSEGATH